MEYQQRVLMPGSGRMAYPVGEFLSQNMEDINNMVTALKGLYPTDTKNINFIVTGSSGAMIGALIGQHYPNCKIVHIKKKGENSHSGTDLLDVVGGRQDDEYVKSINIFVDDFIEMGSTLTRVYDEIEHHRKQKKEFWAGEDKSFINDLESNFSRKTIDNGLKDTYHDFEFDAICVSSIFFLSRDWARMCPTVKTNYVITNQDCV